MGVTPIRIEAPADPRVAPYVSIRERDLTGRGDRFIVEICGGGGYGDPKARDRALVANDLRCGRITKEAASELYGFDGSELAAE